MDAPPSGAEERARKEKKRHSGSGRKDKARDRRSGEREKERSGADERADRDKGKKRRESQAQPAQPASPPPAAALALASPSRQARDAPRYNAQVTPRYMQEAPRAGEEVRGVNPLLRDPSLAAAAEKLKGKDGPRLKGTASSPALGGAALSPSRSKKFGAAGWGRPDSPSGSAVAASPVAASGSAASLPFLGSQFDLDAARSAWKRDAAGLGTRQTEEGKQIVVSGAVEDLVSFLADDQHFQNKDYLEAFVLSHPWFLPSPVFFANLVARFDANLTPREAKADAVQRSLYMRLRIINVIKKWLELNPHNFIEDKTLGTSFDQWVERMTASGGRSQAWATHLSDLRRKQMRLLEWTAPSSKDREPRREGRPPPPLLPKTLGKKELLLLDLDALELARQITLAEYHMFRRISPAEFYRKAWEKKDRAPNIVALISRFNQLSYWVASEVLSAVDAKARQATIARFLETLRHLHELGNFNGVVEISAGLNLSVVQRLKSDWRAVSPKLVAFLKTMNELMAPHNNWASYRRALSERPLPAIPFQGVYLTDMVFIEELPDQLQGGLINFEKMHLIGRLLSDIINAQRQPYVLESVPAIDDWLKQRTVLSDDHLARLSREHEPDGNELKLPIVPEQSESSASSARSAHSGADKTMADAVVQPSSEPSSSSLQTAAATEYSYILEFEMAELVGPRNDGKP